MSKTPDDARKDWLCPVGRIMTPAHDRCIGPECAAWSWKTGAAFAAAVKKLATETGEASPFPKASRAVADEPGKYGLEGVCGFSGQ